MKNWNFNLILIFSLFSSACFLPSKTGISHGCIKEEPNRNEIVGTWIADKATLNDIKERGKYTPLVIPKLVFYEDGKLEAVNMPDWWLDGFGKSNQRFESSLGSWRFFRYKESCVEVSLDLQIVRTNIDLSKSRFNQEPKYIMTKYIGDPDSGNLMVFVKEK